MSAESLRVLFITHSLGSAEEQKTDPLHLLADALLRQGVTVRIAAPDVETAAPAREEQKRSTQSPGALAAVSRSAAEPDATRASAARHARGRTLRYLGTGFGSAVQMRRDFEPDIVHAHWWFPSGLVGSWVSSLASLPLVTSLHGYDPTRTRAGSPARPLFAHVLRRSSAITVESSALIHDVAHVSGAPSPVVAPLPLPSDLFQPAEKLDEVAVISPSNRGHTAELAQLVRALREMGQRVVVVSDLRRGAGIEAAQAAAEAGEGVTSVASTDPLALAATLRSARSCVILHGSERERTTIASAMLAEAAPILVGGSLTDLGSDDNRVSVTAEGASFGEQLDHLHVLLRDKAALQEKGEAARMYTLAARAPDSCAGRMLGVYLRALGDAAA